MAGAGSRRNRYCYDTNRLQFIRVGPTRPADCNRIAMTSSPPESTKTVLRPSVASRAVIAVLLLQLAGACSADSQSDAMSELHSGLSKVDSVRIYYLSATDQPNYSVPEFIKAAGVSVTRRCGANCAVHMKGVLNHFKNAKATECRLGDQSVVILIENLPPLIYSRGGHFIQFRNKCYFNQASINDVVETRAFVFD